MYDRQKKEASTSIFGELLHRLLRRERALLCFSFPRANRQTWVMLAERKGGKRKRKGIGERGKMYNSPSSFFFFQGGAVFFVFTSSSAFFAKEV